MPVHGAALLLHGAARIVLRPGGSDALPPALLHVYRAIRFQGRHAAARIGIAGRSWYQHVRNVIHTKVICAIPRMNHLLCRQLAIFFHCPGPIACKVHQEIAT